ncbi:hypothetical protein TNCV_398511, partial [Trichonephila clavipes]
DSMIRLGITPFLRESTLGEVRGFPPLFPFHQPPDLRLNGNLEYPSPMPQRHKKQGWRTRGLLVKPS